MSGKINRLCFAVNEMEFTEDSSRKLLDCGSCKTPTTGRMKRKPICMDCAMKVMMKPLESVRDILQGMFK